MKKTVACGVVVLILVSVLLITRFRQMSSLNSNIPSNLKTNTEGTQSYSISQKPPTPHRSLASIASAPPIDDKNATSPTSPSYGSQEEKIANVLRVWGDVKNARYLRDSNGSVFKVSAISLNGAQFNSTNMMWMAQNLARVLDIPASSQFESTHSQSGSRLQKFSVQQTVQNSLGQSFEIHNGTVDFIALRSQQKIIEIHNRLKAYKGEALLPNLTVEEAKMLVAEDEKINPANLTVESRLVALVGPDETLQLATVVHSKEESKPFTYFLSHKTKKIILKEIDRIF